MVSWGYSEIQCHNLLEQKPCHDYSNEGAPVMVTLHKVHTKIGPPQILKIFSEKLEKAAGHLLKFFGTSPSSRNGEISIFKKWGEVS